MPTFAYRARNRDGIVVLGELDAVDSIGAARTLRSRSLYIISIRELPAGSRLWQKIVKREEIPRRAEFALFFEEFATLVGAGLPPHEALARLSTEQKSPRGRMIAGLRQALNEGRTLAEAMAEKPYIFPPNIIGLVQAGESGGVLDEVLQSLADSLSDNFATGEKIKSTLAYPLFLLGAVLSAIGLMTFLVLPVFGSLLVDMGANIPLPTLILLNTADFISNRLWILPLLLLLAGGITVLIMNSHSCRRQIDRMLLSLPLIGELLIYEEWRRLLQTLALLLNSGIRLDKAIGLLVSVTSNRVLQDYLVTIRERLIRGNTLGQTLIKDKLLPPVLVNMLKAGEQAGELEHMLTRASKYAGVIADNRSARLQALAEPLMIVIIGLIIFGLVLSLMLPLLEAMDKLL